MERLTFSSLLPLAVAPHRCSVASDQAVATLSLCPVQLHLLLGFHAEAPLGFWTWHLFHVLHPCPLCFGRTFDFISPQGSNPGPCTCWVHTLPQGEHFKVKKLTCLFISVMDDSVIISSHSAVRPLSHSHPESPSHSVACVEALGWTGLYPGPEAVELGPQRCHEILLRVVTHEALPCGRDWY